MENLVGLEDKVSKDLRDCHCDLNGKSLKHMLVGCSFLALLALSICLGYLRLGQI